MPLNGPGGDSVTKGRPSISLKPAGETLACAHRGAAHRGVGPCTL